MKIRKIFIVLNLGVGLFVSCSELNSSRKGMIGNKIFQRYIRNKGLIKSNNLYKKSFRCFSNRDPVFNNLLNFMYDEGIYQELSAAHKHKFTNYIFKYGASIDMNDYEILDGLGRLLGVCYFCHGHYEPNEISRYDICKNCERIKDGELDDHLLKDVKKIIVDEDYKKISYADLMNIFNIGRERAHCIVHSLKKDKTIDDNGKII